MRSTLASNGNSPFDEDGAVLWDVASGQLKTHPRKAIRVTGQFRGVFHRMVTTLASASRDKTVRLWDVATAANSKATLEGHTGWSAMLNPLKGPTLVVSIPCLFPPMARTLASASVSDDGWISLWDVASGQPETASFSKAM